MSSVLVHNGGVLVSNGVAISHEGGSSANIQEDKSYTVAASGNQTISPDTGYDAMEEVALTVPSGSATTPATTIMTNPTITINDYSSSTVNPHVSITATVSATESVTPTVTSGYVSSGTAGNISVGGVANTDVPALNSRLINPSLTSDVVIPANTYITGNISTRPTVIQGLVPENIKDGANIKVGYFPDYGALADITGTYTGGGGSILKFYSDFVDDHTLYTDQALTTTIAEAYNYDYATIYSVLSSADGIVIQHNSDHKTAWATSMLFDSIDETFNVFYASAGYSTQTWLCASIYEY